MKGISFRGVPKNAFRGDTLGGREWGGDREEARRVALESKAISGWSLIFYVTLTTEQSSIKEKTGKIDARERRIKRESEQARKSTPRRQKVCNTQTKIKETNSRL